MWKKLFSPEVPGFELVPDIYLFVIKIPLNLKIFPWILLLDNIFAMSDLFLFFKLGLPAIALLEHGLVPALQLYANLSILAILNTKEVILKIVSINKRFHWPMENIKISVKERIYYQAKELRITFYSMTIFLAVYMYELPNGPNKDLNILYAMEHFPGAISSTGIILCWCNGIFISSCVILAPFALFYLCFEWTVQLQILNTYLQDMFRANKSTITSTENDNYQKMVRQTLIKVVIRQNELREQYLLLSQSVPLEPLKLILGNVGYTTFIILSYLKGFLPSSLLIIHFSVFSMVFTYACILGQRYEDKWREFATILYQLPWYDFNLKNKKLYLTILIGQAKITTFAVWNNIAQNYELFLEVWTILYKIANALFNLKG